jgi:hypothetical protein
VPAKTPPDTINAINEAVHKTLATSAVSRRLYRLTERQRQ